MQTLPELLDGDLHSLEQAVLPPDFGLPRAVDVYEQHAFLRELERQAVSLKAYVVMISAVFEEARKSQRQNGNTNRLYFRVTREGIWWDELTPRLKLREGGGFVAHPGAVKDAW